MKKLHNWIATLVTFARHDRSGSRHCEREARGNPGNTVAMTALRHPQ